MSLLTRADGSFLGRWWWTIDRGLLSAFFMLILFGIILVSTASPAVAIRIGVGPYHFLTRHLIMLGPSVFMLIGISMMPPRQIWRLCSVVYGLTVIGMIAVLFTGMEIKGAQRWVHFGGLSIQPSEFAKPCFAVVSAWFMALQKSRENFSGDRIAAGLYFLIVCLLLLQPDFGMTFVLTCIWASQIFLAGFPFRLLFVLGLTGAGGIAAAYYGFSHVHSRIDRFLDPDSGDNYQVERSLEGC